MKCNGCKNEHMNDGCECCSCREEEKDQLQAEKDELKKLLCYLSGTQDDYQHKYPVKHHDWAVGQENGSITGDFDEWLIKQALQEKGSEK